MTNLYWNRSRILICAAAIIGLSGFSEVASASVMVWQGPEKISADADVKTEGTLIGAYSFGNSLAGSSVATVNGVNFYGAIGNTTYGYATSSQVKFSVDSFGGGAANPFASLTTPYKALLSRGIYTSSPFGPMTITLSGLTPNQTYLIQFWVNDSRGSAGNGGPTLHQQILSCNGDETPEIFPMDSVTVNGTVGNHITGYLTMGAGETTATIQAISTSGTTTTRINAMQIRTVDGKTSWMNGEKYGIFMHFLPGGVLPLPNAASAQIVSPQTQSAWSQTVANFNVNAFADQVAEAGAGYVVFANGQSQGFYCSPNAAYEGYGPIVPGELTSQRDLIADLSVALNSRGIKLMVYMAGEGPQRAPVFTSQAGGSVNMAVKTYAAPGAVDYPTTGTNGPAYHYKLRNCLNAMVTEYSNRWGTAVSGWWFDGCFQTGTGYGNLSDNGQGLNNLNALIAAAKSGNPNAIVACNPGVNNVAALSANQDYTAGEVGITDYTNPLTILYSKFFLYPAGRFVTYGGSNIQWHTLSYLGTTWRASDLKYSTEELINYVSSVNRLGGVVTMDVAFTSTGAIYAPHLAQLKSIKAALKPNSPPRVTLVPAPAFVNLAKYKPSYLRDNSPGNIADPEKACNQSLGVAFRAHFGQDGDPTTYARAGGTYEYSYIVDLESNQNFDRVELSFVTGWATSYEIYYSTNGSTWSYLNPSQTNYAATGVGHYSHDANALKNGRYIKVKALTPNGSGQPGGQMCVAELEVYNVNGSASTASDTIWVDDDIPVGAARTWGVYGSTSWKLAGLLSGVIDSPLPLWSTYNNPNPQGGMKVHWADPHGGWNEHGFINAHAPLVVGTGDSLYAWAWIDAASPTTQIQLKWKASDGTTGDAYWAASGTNPLGSTGPRVGNLPATGTWAKLSVPASSVGLVGKKLTDMNYVIYGGKVVFDRSGKTH